MDNEHEDEQKAFDIDPEGSEPGKTGPEEPLAPKEPGFGELPEQAEQAEPEYEEEPEPEEPLTQEESLSLALEAEKESEEAAGAAINAYLAARKAILALMRDRSGGQDDDPDGSTARFMRAKLEAARQAMNAADAAINAQKAAVELLESALRMARKEHALTELRQMAAASDLRKLLEAQPLAEYGGEAGDAGALPEPTAWEDEKTAAWSAACAGARKHRELADQDEEESRARMTAVRDYAAAAAARLQELKQELASERESARLLMEEAAGKNVPLADDLRLFFAGEEPPPAPPEEKKQLGFWRSFWGGIGAGLKLLAFALAIVIILQNYVLEFTRVDGTSMTPTLGDRDCLITLKITYLFGGSPQRGDIVVLEAPDKHNEYYIKRIIGLPGETIVITDGKVYINGELLDEPYLKGIQAKEDDDINITILEGTYFVMGDNRASSHDSRNGLVGLIGESKIRGKSVLRFWPFDVFGGL
ncbi:MAG: signal peptidase I [Clostridiales bacterium]|nr:signal peptidase I [Clostridiales bacterium]